ncbi:hypothetical protein V8E36_002699 [Tilletia maclaganii]
MMLCTASSSRSPLDESGEPSVPEGQVRSRCNKSKRSAEISTPAASVIQTREVKLHKLQADVSGLRAPEAVPAPSTSASYRMKTANPRSSSCSPCLTSGDHLAFFQADGQDLIDIPQRKDARGGRVDAVPRTYIAATAVKDKLQHLLGHSPNPGQEF